MKKFLALILLAAAALGLAGCNKGGHNQNSTDLRALNAVVDAEPLDILVADDVKFPALATNASSGFVNFTAGTLDTKVRSSTTQAVLVDTTLSYPSGVRSTLLVFGKRAGINTLQLAEDPGTPASGKVRVRVVGLSPDVGQVDVYITPNDISSGPAVVGAASYGAATTPVEITAGSYKIIMTSAGTQEIVFQSPSTYTFNAGSNVTLLVMPSLGGRLVNAAVMEQGPSGAITFIANTQARVKAVNGITDATAINFKLAGATLFSNVPFTGASSYLTVANGAKTATIEASNVPGTTIASRSVTLDSSRDYTLLSLGTTASPSLVALTDDNTLPATGYAKVRFVNALADGGNVDVLVNFATQATGIARGAASAYYAITAGTNYTIGFATPGGTTLLASISGVELDAPNVYTVYLFGTTAAAQAKLIRDR